MTQMPNAAPRMRVVVADDIESSRNALCDMVRALGHEAVPCASGRAALGQIMLDTPDVVLLDLLMPDLDGFEVVQLLRSRQTDRWLPVIVTSSLHGEEPFIRALRQGADDYLTRPVNPALLEAKLDHYRRVLRLQSGMAAMARRQQAILDNILDAVLTFSADGRIAESNLAAARMFAHHGPLRGASCETLLGLPLEELAQRTELSLRREDGSEFPGELAHSEWREGASTLHTLMVRDLTERRQIDRMKDEFLATVSHELRTPLTSVLGALGLLASGAAGSLPPAAEALSGVAKRNGERLSRLIDDILDLSKLESNRMPLHPKRMQLDALVQEAMNANQGYAARAGVAIDLALQPDTAWVEVDPDRFLQVMANLLSNAIKHSTPGSRVTLALAPADGGVLVAVRDRGPGIGEQYLSRMFEKFSQEDSTDRRAKGGTGLGLYITRILVERMGGHIAVESVQGQGATFNVFLPAAASGAGHARPRLLHIDRDADAQQRIADWLGADYAVEGMAELDKARPLAARPAAIIADPQGQGNADAFCEAFRQVAAGCPVLLYSDSISPAFARQAGLPWLQKYQTTPEQLSAELARTARPQRPGS